MSGKLALEDYLSQKVGHVLRIIAEEDGVDLPADFRAVMETPKDEKNGDISCNAAMQLAKVFRANPRTLAERIIENLGIADEYVERIETAGPGFINFYISREWYLKELKTILDEKTDYGSIVPEKAKTIDVEYVSANPTGPPHIGNARGGVIGDVLANVYAKLGWKVTKEFYLNDYGNQIKKFGESLMARFRQISDPEFPFPEDGYRGKDITELAEKFAGDHPETSELKDEELADTLSAYGLKANVANMHDVLDRYGIHYDVWFPESDLHKSGAVDRAVELLRSNGAVYEKDGAVWFKATDYDCDKDEVLIRANGIPTYFASDIAYHLNKLSERHFDLAVNVWGADHHGHVHRLKMAMKACGIDPDRLQVVLMQLVHLVRGSETVKMSKRRGDAVSLEEFLGEVPLDAVRYLFNTTNPNSHLVLDLDMAIKTSLENPVFYVQYAHARICSILCNVKREDGNADYGKLTDRTELALIKQMTTYSTAILNAAEEFDPSKITKFVYDLANVFHSFYNACRVANDDPALTNARLDLCMAVRFVLESALCLLGVSAPEEM
ncbi:MAG: arginine--tRNA ligase [Eubacteriales bacterium]|nr:arginine--tRNA ligase [Eubacteriales bacterium]